MDEGILIATWGGVAVAALVGLGGLIVGVVGLVQARNARNTAASANLIARDSNAVARAANSFASEANRFASEANTIARDANSIATSQAAKAQELHRLDWSFDWTGFGIYQIRNLGPDAASDVRAQITVRHETKILKVDRMESGEAHEILFPEAKELLETWPESGSGGSYRMGVPPVMIRQLITWFSPMGNPKTFDDTNYGARLQ